MTEISHHAQYAPTRRQVLSGGLAASAAALSLMSSSRARADEQATILGWAGYEMDGMHGQYATKYGQKPDFTMFADEDEAFTKVRAGFQPDITLICSYEIKRWREAGIIQPVDEKRLSNFPDLIPYLKDTPGSVVDGTRWWVPLDWGNTSVTYRTDLVDIKEESWGILWDERYAGKLSMFSTVADGMAIAPIYMGIDPYRMNDQQIADVRKMLEKQRPLLRYYSADKTGIEQGLASGELVAAVTASDSYVRLKKQGLPVKFMSPKEGIMTWACGIVVMKDAERLDKGYDALDSMISPDSGVSEMQAFGFGHANLKAFNMLSDEQLADTGLPRDPEAFLKNGVLQQPFEDKEKLVKMFEEVMAGL